MNILKLWYLRQVKARLFAIKMRWACAIIAAQGLHICRFETVGKTTYLVDPEGQRFRIGRA